MLTERSPAEGIVVFRFSNRYLSLFLTLLGAPIFCFGYFMFRGAEPEDGGYQSLLGKACLLFGGIFLIGGFGCIFSFRSVVIDQSRRVLHWCHSRFIFRSVRKFPFHEVQCIFIREMKGRKPSPTLDLLLVPAKGRPLALTGTNTWHDDKKVESIAHRMSELTGIRIEWQRIPNSVA